VQENEAVAVGSGEAFDAIVSNKKHCRGGVELV
jgi:hypothetical protein